MSELGQKLKEAREEKGMSLEDLQEETKIQKRYLKAIEDGEYGKLPGSFYTRAFIKNYAEMVGLNFEELANEYRSEMPGTHPEMPPEDVNLPPGGNTGSPAGSGKVSRVGSGSSRWSSFLNKAIVTVIVLIIMALIYILLTTFMSGNSGDQPQNDAAGGGSDVSYKGSSSSEAGSSDESSSASEESESSSESSSSAEQTVKQESAQGSTTTYTLSGADQFSVEITAKEDAQSWISATDTGKNKRLAYEMATADHPIKFDASDVDTLRIQIGNVPGTTLKINGEELTLPTRTTVQNVIIHNTK